ncbi:MAG TPA: acyltransferase, partial [Frankiaceae bacterium]|nr:acyltransferase [Frankiaceae bacterium]
MERTPALRHVPALDGVRGAAVLAVLLFHGGVAWLPGGFLGVDAFFVLSGYLITSLLLAGQPLAEFWERRARRLLPALLLLVVVGLLLGAVTPLNAAPRDALCALVYLSNWRSYATGGGYFASFAEPSAFKHTWSLAVEAQFYVLWPLIVVYACRRARAPVLAAAGAGALASAVAMSASFTPYGDPARAYYGTDTRIQALLVGAALAVVLTTAGRPRLLTLSGVLGAAVSVAGWRLADGSAATLYGGGFLLAAVGTAAVIAAVVLVPAGPLARALSVRPLRLLGRVSYGVYLWHWPVFLLLTHGRTGLSGPLLLAARLAVTAACTAVSWYAVEVPARTWRPRLPAMPALRASRVAVAGVAAFALAASVVLAPGEPTGPAALAA